MCHCSTEVFSTLNYLCWFSGACASSTCQVWEGNRSIGWTAGQKAKLFPPNQLEQDGWRSCLLPFEEQTVLSLAFLFLWQQILGSAQKNQHQKTVWERLTELKWHLDITREH